jgi:hypothetical protein
MTLHLIPLRPLAQSTKYNPAGATTTWTIRADADAPASGIVTLHADGRYRPVDCNGREMRLTLSLERAAISVMGAGA